jgi:hypothetical protein
MHDFFDNFMTTQGVETLPGSLNKNILDVKWALLCESNT